MCAVFITRIVGDIEAVNDSQVHFVALVLNVGRLAKHASANLCEGYIVWTSKNNTYICGDTIVYTCFLNMFER